MATQQQQSLSRKASSLAWRAEQTLTLLLALSVGTAMGLLIGLFRAFKSLAPHFRSTDGLRRLYHGDPSLANKFQRGYLKESYTSATLKPHGASPTLSSTEVGKTAVPSLVNGDFSGHTEKTSGLLRAEETTPGTGTANGDSGSSFVDKHTPKSTTTIASSTAKYDESSTSHSIPTGTVTPKSTTGGDVTPALEETEGEDSETEDEGTGSEYTATSSTPGTPRSTIMAPPTDVKKKKKTGRKIKKAFSKIADVFTPSSSSTATKA